MATYAENLIAAREALAAALAANPTAVSYSIDGQSVSWGELWDRLAKMDAAIAAAQGPVQVDTHGVV